MSLPMGLQATDTHGTLFNGIGNTMPLRSDAPAPQLLSLRELVDEVWVNLGLDMNYPV